MSKVLISLLVALISVLSGVQLFSHEMRSSLENLKDTSELKLCYERPEQLQLECHCVNVVSAAELIKSIGNYFVYCSS